MDHLCYKDRLRAGAVQHGEQEMSLGDLRAACRYRKGGFKERADSLAGPAVTDQGREGRFRLDTRKKFWGSGW